MIECLASCGPDDILTLGEKLLAWVIFGWFVWVCVENEIAAHKRRERNSRMR